MSARNFNPTMAKAAKITIAEVEEIVKLGDLNPDEVHLSGIFVDKIVKGEKYEKRIEKVTVQKLSDSKDSIIKKNPAADRRERIIRRAALEFKDGMYGILLQKNYILRETTPNKNKKIQKHISYKVKRNKVISGM